MEMMDYPKNLHEIGLIVDPLKDQLDALGSRLAGSVIGRKECPMCGSGACVDMTLRDVLDAGLREINGTTEHLEEVISLIGRHAYNLTLANRLQKAE